MYKKVNIRKSKKVNIRKYKKVNVYGTETMTEKMIEDYLMK